MRIAPPARDFLLQNVSNATLAIRGNIPAAAQKGFVRIANFIVALP
jgi:hypothetical protein